MPPPPTPMRTVVAPATPAGQQLTRGTGGPGLGPATVTGPGPTTVTRSEPRRPQGLEPPAGPAHVTRSSSRVEFNAQMSNEDVLKALKQLLPNQFKEPPEVAAEFAEGYVAPAEDANRTIAGRLLERILTNEDLDVGFSMDREMAMHNLRGLWRRVRREEHERQPPHARPGLRQPPLPMPESEEHLDAQGLEPIGLEGEALGDYLAQLKEAVRTWWKTVGPADDLPYQHGWLVDPSGLADGERWPSDNFLKSQVQTLWALERAERTFAEGLDVAEPARLWLTGERVKRFSGLHDSPQRAPDDKGRCVRYVSLYTPVDPTPKPPDRGTHLTLPDNTAVLPDLPHLQPEEMREMEMVLQSYWQTEARAPHGDERFKGLPPEELQMLVEIDPVVRRILEYRVHVLHRRYPDQLPAVACEGLLTALPPDIRLVGSPELGRFMPIHVVTVSSPCQGLSHADRNGRGLANPRSELISEAWRILGYLSRHQTVKPAYTFEMVDARDHPSQDARDGFSIIDRVAGEAVDMAIVINAAKLGSAAHRVRAFWTNAAPSRTLKQRYAQFDREWVNDRKEAQDVLRNGRRVNTAPSDDPDIKGYYRMNFEGEPIRVFRMLVSTPQSFAFRRQEGGPIPGRPGPGMVYDPEMRGWMEPTADERELIMGLLPGSTRAPGAGEDQRRAAIGSAIDVRAYSWLWREIRRWRALHYDEDLA
jgi:site-specific DNA-cytosine methylase